MKKSIKSKLSKIVSLLAVAVIGAPGIASIPAAAYIRDNLDADKTWAAEYESWDAIAEAAADLNVRLAEESITLLKNKNNALPLAKNAKVTVIGSAANNLSQGGGGSGAQNQPTKGATAENNYDIYDALELNGFEVNPTAKATYTGSTRSGSSDPNEEGTYMAVGSAEDAGAVEFGGTYYVTKPGSQLEAAESTFAEYGDAAIVVVTRTGSEFQDCASNNVPGHTDKSDHYFMFEDAEKEMLAYAKKHFDKVILVLNSPSAMELGDVEKDDAIQSVVWIGQLGWNGAIAVGSVLNGDVNPSGHTVDFYMEDLDTDPSVMNSLNYRRAYYAKTGEFGNSSNTIPMAGADDATSSYIGKTYAMDYAEGIYMGYRYYETVAADLGAAGEDWYDANTTYSFGHGLSYTTFKQTIKEVKGDLSKADGEVTVAVEVENTGDVAGKEVVQLYVSKPYTEGGIEKAAVDLIGFAKTSELAAGAKETVEVTFAVKDLASFDYDDRNGNDFNGYELEEGEYVLSIRENSHDVLDSKVLEAEKAFTWDEDGNPDTPNNIYSQPKDTAWGEFNTLAHNWTQDGEDHYLSRTDLVVDGEAANLTEQLTWLLEEGGNKFINEAHEVWGHYTNGYAWYDYDNAQTPEVEKDFNNLWNKTAADLEGWTQGTGVKDEYGNYEMLLSEMMGVPFEDEKWVTFMNQLTWQELIDAISSGAYNTIGVDSINKPYVTDQDGPGQLKGNKGSGWAWVCEVNIASTWNVDIAYEQGRVVGEESMWVDSNGWYGPAMNTHRNALCGRNFEYYSQDGIQGGLIAAAVVKGAVEKGCHVYAKHAFLNDQETSRMNMCVFATEQSIREIYAKPFELVMKKGEGNGFMTAFVRIGLASSCSYATNIQLYENEWGYDGLSVTDFYSAGNSGWSGWAMARATCIPLGTTSQKIDGTWDADKNVVVCNYKDGTTFDGYTQWFWVRNTAQRIFYMAVNGNAMANGLVDIPMVSDLELTQGQNIGTQNLFGIETRRELMKFYGADGWEIFEIEGLPRGMSYAGNGFVTGTPSQSGNFKVTLHIGGLGEKQFLNATFYLNLTVAASTGDVETAIPGMPGLDGIPGTDGKDGKDGVGIESITIVDGVLTIILTDGTVVEGVVGPGATEDPAPGFDFNAILESLGLNELLAQVGCGSTVAGTAIAAIVAMGVVILRKKED